MMALYFPASFSNAEVDAPYKALADVLTSKGGSSIAAGWAVEEQEHESLGAEKGKAFVLAIGGESVEGLEKDHGRKEAEDAFKALRGLSVGVSSWYVKYNAY